jgi:hypothetical protein
MQGSRLTGQVTSLMKNPTGFLAVGGCLFRLSETSQGAALKNFGARD